MPSSRKLLAAAGSALVAATLAGCGTGAVGSSGVAAKTAKPGASPAVKAAAVVGPADRSAQRGSVREVADPQEAASFPAPPSVHHAAAATPAKAGEVVVAAGAPSDAEVRSELKQMQAVERNAKQARQRQQTAVAGGRSI